MLTRQKTGGTCRFYYVTATWMNAAGVRGPPARFHGADARSSGQGRAFPDVTEQRAAAV